MGYELFSEIPDPAESFEAELLEEGVVWERLSPFPEVTEQFESNGESESTEMIIGNPEKDDDNWHLQSETNSCAVVCQEFVAEQLLDKEFTEEEMINIAKENGWYNSDEGTSPKDVGNILEALGLNVEKNYDVTIQEISEMLGNGEKIIVGVNGAVLQCPSLAECQGIRADHVVEVIGIDATDPQNVQVILNDSGTEFGKGIRRDLDTFLAAWKTSGNYTVSAY